jgi:hypothetical protein
MGRGAGLFLNSSIVRIWRQVFGEPPAIVAPNALIISILVENLPPAPPYRPGCINLEPAEGEDEL